KDAGAPSIFKLIINCQRNALKRLLCILGDGKCQYSAREESRPFRKKSIPAKGAKGFGNP
ncbi:MAG TPA: hypothetical protein PLC40_17085, partial [Candidatus Hydrogenedentes bacterium]|nr:hypothetical protein [Candidatus Hydrogenedentota bacterium]